MREFRLTPLSAAQNNELDVLYRTAKDVRDRTRAQMILLASEQSMSAPEIAMIVRESDQTVRNWLKRYELEGVEGLHDRPRPGAPRQVTAEYQHQLIEAVRRRPRCLDLPYSMLRRLADYMAEQTGIRASIETVRGYLVKAEIVLSRPQHKISNPDPEYEVKKRRLKRPVII